MSHKWDSPPPKHKVIDSLINYCVKCGCLREWVSGKPNYFLGDSSYQKAPKCKPIDIIK